MNAYFPIAVVILLVAVVALLSNISLRLQKLERCTRLLLQDRAPTDRVRLIADDPSQRIEAMRAYREETGLGVREAQAVIDALQARSR